MKLDWRSVCTSMDVLSLGVFVVVDRLTEYVHQFEVLWLRIFLDLPTCRRRLENFGTPNSNIHLRSRPQSREYYAFCEEVTYKVRF